VQTVFVRHNCSSTQHVLEQLWKRRLIALHYENKLSTNPADYGPKGRNALKRLWKYCTSGAIVGADYRRLGRAAMLVGELPKNSRVQGEEFRDPDTGHTFIYKVAVLHRAREVRFVDYPLLLGRQPRQATITGWPSAARVLEAAIHNHPLPYDASCLHPSQLEVLCYEYLRERHHLERLLMPIGRSLLDIDILGLDKDGNKVLAQVTHSMSKSKLDDKRQRLLQHALPSDKCFFFVPERAPLAVSPNVESIPITRVLSALKASSRVSTKRMLSEMFAGHS